MLADSDLDGFLSEEPSFETRIAGRYAKEFDLARRVNRECHALILNADVRNRDGQSMLASALFLRALQHFQGAILLLRKGLVGSAKVAIRAELEAIFTLGAVISDEESYRAFVNADLRERFELIKKAKNYDYPILRPLREAVSDEEFSEMATQAKLAANRKISVKELSVQAKLHELYVSAYQLLSRAVHSIVGEIDAYFVANENGDIREIEYSPQLDEVGETTLVACDFILLAADILSKHLGVATSLRTREELAQMILAS